MTNRLGDEGVRRRHAHHAVRVHRGRRDAVRDGRRERAPRGDPRRNADEAERARGLVRRSAADRGGVSVPRGDRRVRRSRRGSPSGSPAAPTAAPTRSARRRSRSRSPRSRSRTWARRAGSRSCASRCTRSGSSSRSAGSSLTIAFWACRVDAVGGGVAAFAASWGARARDRVVRLGEGAAPVRARGIAAATAIPEEHAGALLRFGALRAPATLFTQLIFWTDFFVLSVLCERPGRRPATPATGVYGAVLRAGQSLFLFLTSVSLTFSPFVADLHHRGERERLDGLYKSVTRWTLAATIPVLLRARGPARAGAAHLRRASSREGDARAADPDRRDDRAGDGRDGRLHPDHGGPHRMGPGRVRGVVRDRRRRRARARSPGRRSGSAAPRSRRP